MYYWDIHQVVFEDWTTDKHQPNTGFRIVDSKDWDIAINYDKGIMIISREGQSQREIIPVSRIYSILENKVED